MFEATQDGLGRNAPVHSIHGSLLAVGELLRWVEICVMQKPFLATEAVSFSSLSRFSLKKVDCLISKFIIAMIASCPLIWCELPS